MEMIQVMPMRVTQAGQVAQLFRHGLYHDFNYFPADYMKVTRKRNSAYRLRLATIKPQRIVLLAKDSAKPAGFSISNSDRDGVHFLFWLYVYPDFRGRGIGKMLIETVIQNAQKSKCHIIRLATHNNQNFYKRLGFSTNDALTFTIGEITMVIMEKSLS